MKQFIFVVALIFYFGQVLTQGVLFYSPTEQAIGRTGALGSTSWSFFSNPAGIASVENSSAGIGYYSGFHIKELSSRAAFVAIPLSLLTGATGFSHFGFEHYSLQQYSVAAARQMAPWLRLGIKFNYFLRSQTGSRQYEISTLDAGFQIEPDPKVSVGFYVINPARVKWKLQDWDEYQPSVVAAALAYKPVTSLILELGVLKDADSPASTSFSIEAPLYNKMATLRGALSTEPLRLGFGAGIQWRFICFDLGLNHHETLGFSSSFGMLFNISYLSRHKSQDK